MMTTAAPATVFGQPIAERELDFRIATEVLDWIHRAGSGKPDDDDPENWERFAMRATNRDGKQYASVNVGGVDIEIFNVVALKLPDFSTSWGGMEFLIHKLQEQFNCTVKLEFYPKDHPDRVIANVKWPNGAWTKDGHAEAPMALCLAALRG